MIDETIKTTTYFVNVQFEYLAQCYTVPCIVEKYTVETIDGTKRAVQAWPLRERHESMLRDNKHFSRPLYHQLCITLFNQSLDAFEADEGMVLTALTGDPWTQSCDHNLAYKLIH